MHVVDGDEQPVAAARLFVRGAAGKLAVQDLGPGAFAVADLPQQGVTFAVDFGGREFAVTPEPGATTARLVVPTLATVLLGPLPLGFALPKTGSIGVRAQSLEPRGQPFDLRLPKDGEPLGLLPPGRYRFALVRNEWDAERQVTETTELAAAAEIDLAAGAPTTVTLR